jgi:hypothetical protein
MNKKIVISFLFLGILVSISILLIILLGIGGNRENVLDKSKWDSENRFAEIVIEGKFSEKITGFDLVFVFGDGELTHYIEKEEENIQLKCLDFGNTSGELEYIKLIPVFSDGVRGDVISEISADRIRRSDLVSEGQCERKIVHSSGGGTLGKLEGINEGSTSSSEGMPEGGDTINETENSCVPSLNCSYYYAQSKCGYNLYNGCTNSLNCVQCSEDNYCYIGQGISNICLNNNIKCEDSGNINNYIKGFVKLKDTTINDFCIENNTIKHYCYYNGNDFEIRNYSFQCSYGCNDGACVMPPYEASGVLELSRTGGYASLSNNDFDDLDYTKDFSVEVLTKIEPHSVGGRWASFIQKSGNRALYLPESGFAIGTNQGHLEHFGQTITAKVGDGTNNIAINSPTMEGYVYAVMVWDYSNKKLTLYINGNQSTSANNSVINLSALKNNNNLDVGRGNSRNINRDIFMIRLWNRALNSVEINNLWSNYEQNGRDILPTNFNKNQLKSEWLMQENSDVNGSLGATHLKDTFGKNHLELKQGAEIVNSQNTLTMIYPADGQNGVDKSVSLKVIGGQNDLTGYELPLRYYFQIDESQNFNSVNLKESGWIFNYGKWKPLLKPNTKYYWRVKVGDSLGKESSFTQVKSFTTDGPKDWFVRPGIYSSYGSTPTPAQGIYGLQDGKDYENAWNGIREIKWGEGGVSPGDNLYVCGRHVYETTSGDFLAYQATEFIKESGYSDEYPITIRMDCPNDEGRLYGIFKDRRTEINWVGPDANGVYSANFSYTTRVEYNGTDYIWLKLANSTTWTGNNGHYFKQGNTHYIKTTDGSSPMDKMYSSSVNFAFDLGRSKYIKFYKGNFYGSIVGKQRIYHTRTKIPVSINITFDSCKMIYGVTYQLYAGHDYWKFKNNHLSYAGNGIYTIGQDSGFNNGIGASYLLVQNNTFKHLGTREFYHQDAHAIGGQGGRGHIIEYNYIEDSGSAIEYWIGPSRIMQDMIIRNNFIKNIKVKDVTGGGGIVVSGENSEHSIGRRTGFKIYNNIVMNTGLDKTEGWQGGGIGTNNKDFVGIYNNIIINPAGRGTGFGVMNDFPAQGAIYNNIIIKPKDRYVQIVGGGSNWDNFFSDNNIYWGATGLYNSSEFYFARTIDRDNNSILTTQQLFISSNPQEPEDFRPRPDSPAIDAGVLIPGIHCETSGAHPGKDCVEWYGSAPDIGAYEYIPEGTVQSTQSYSLFSRITNVLTGKVISNKITEKFMFFKIALMLFLVFLTLFIIRKIKLKKDI